MASNNWFRSWHGAPTDNKWLLIAKKSGVPAGVVSAIVWALLDHASQHEERGTVSDFDIETYSVFSGFDMKHIETVVTFLAEKGVICDGRLSAWEKRQPKKEGDNSSDRVRAFRERKKNQQVTEMKRDETPCNEMKRDETLDKIREDKDKIKEKIYKKENSSLDEKTPDQAIEGHFEIFWNAYPKRKGTNSRKEALLKFKTKVKAGISAETVIDGARRYCAYIKSTGKDNTEYVKQAVSWLNQELWDSDYGGKPKAANSSTKTVPEDVWREVISKFKKHPFTWPTALGPSPDMPGCRVPPEILSEFGLRAA